MTQTNTDFKNLIQKNLGSNGFPQKKVSFSLERLYELADQKDANLNNVLAQMDDEGIGHEKGLDKIIFFSKATPFDFENLDRDSMMDQAQKMMGDMTPEQIQEVQNTLASMTPKQKNDLMNKAREMGLV